MEKVISGLENVPVVDLRVEVPDTETGHLEGCWRGIVRRGRLRGGMLGVVMRSTITQAKAVTGQRRAGRDPLTAVGEKRIRRM